MVLKGKTEEQMIAKEVARGEVTQQVTWSWVEVVVVSRESLWSVVMKA